MSLWLYLTVFHPPCFLNDLLKYSFVDLFWLCWVSFVSPELFIVACTLIKFPSQGSNPGPLHWEHSPTHWTTMEVPCISKENNVVE